MLDIGPWEAFNNMYKVYEKSWIYYSQSSKLD